MPDHCVANIQPAVFHNNNVLRTSTSASKMPLADGKSLKGNNLRKHDQTNLCSKAAKNLLLKKLSSFAHKIFSYAATAGAWWVPESGCSDGWKAAGLDVATFQRVWQK